MRFSVILSILLLFPFLFSSSPGLLGGNFLEEKARLHFYQGEFQEAVALYQKLIEKHQKPAHYFDLACLYREIGKEEQALELLRQLHLLEPAEPRWFREKGILYYQLGYYAAASFPLEKSLALQPHREGYLYLGLSQWALEDSEGAIENLKQALELYPHFALGHFRLGATYDSLADIESAIAHYRLALRFDPSMTEIHTLLGEKYLELGDYPLAYQRFSQAVRVDPNPLNQARLEEMEARFPHLVPVPKEEAPSTMDTIIWEPVAPSLNPEGVPQVRVMLLEGAQELDLMMGGAFTIRRTSQGEILGRGEGREIWQVRPAEDGFVLFQGDWQFPFTQSLYLTPIEETYPFLLFNIRYGHGYFWAGSENRRYRGHLELKMVNGQLMAVNHLNLEEYLYSVVPSEMPASWPMEGLKAQAVAARTYTLRRLGGGEYDVCATVLSAVYRGIAAEHVRSTQAVHATRGEILTWQGEIIDAVYSSNVGGHTESSAQVWGGERPYLQPVSTDKKPGEPYLSPGELREWLIEGVDSYSNQPPYTSPNQYRWVRRFHVKDLQARYPDLGAITHLQITSRGEGGSVLSLTLLGEEGERIFTGDSIRGAFHNLRSNRFVVERIYEEGQLQEFLFYGGGFGHSVGMGQTEAAAMAREGFHYLEILKFFYPGVQEQKAY